MIVQLPQSEGVAIKAQRLVEFVRWDFQCDVSPAREQASVVRHGCNSLLLHGFEMAYAVAFKDTSETAVNCLPSSICKPVPDTK